MTNYKHFLILIVIIVLSSCAPYGGQLRYRFKFMNNTDKDIYIVIDTKTDNQSISPRSFYDFVFANNWRYIDNKRPWDEIIKDSAYIYILDASLIDLHPLEQYLSEEKCKYITQEMIMGRMTVYHEDFITMNTLSYPTDE